jgi:hypothetical protein
MLPFCPCINPSSLFLLFFSSVKTCCGGAAEGEDEEAIRCVGKARSKRTRRKEIRI